MERARVAVVTGGRGALGSAVVAALLERGWTVHAPRREGDDPAPTRVGLEQHEADVADPEQVERLFAAVDARSGRLDALVNIAGGFAAAPIERTTPEDWSRMLATNATTAFLCARAAVPRMKATGGGRIVSVAAAAALAPRPGMAAYVASKAVVVALTRALAAELSEHRITVNAIAPTTIDTEANRAAMPKADRTGWVAPAAIADTILFLLDDGSGAVTGTIVEMGR